MTPSSTPSLSSNAKGNSSFLDFGAPPPISQFNSPELRKTLSKSPNKLRKRNTSGASISPPRSDIGGEPQSFFKMPKRRPSMPTLTPLRTPTEGLTRHSSSPGKLPFLRKRLPSMPNLSATVISPYTSTETLVQLPTPGTRSKRSSLASLPFTPPSPPKRKPVPLYDPTASEPPKVTETPPVDPPIIATNDPMFTPPEGPFSTPMRRATTFSNNPTVINYSRPLRGQVRFAAVGDPNDRAPLADIQNSVTTRYCLNYSRPLPELTDDGKPTFLKPPPTKSKKTLQREN